MEKSSKWFIRVTRKSDKRMVSSIDVTSDRPERRPQLLKSAKARYDLTQYNVELVMVNFDPKESYETP